MSEMKKVSLSRGQIIDRLVQMGPSILICIIFASLPWFSPTYTMGLVTVCLIGAICAMAYDLIFGYAGLLSFGHVAGWGIGAYTVGMLVGKGITQNFFIVLGVAILAALIISAFFAFLALRTHGIYFSLITLALAELLHALTIKWASITGGENGLTGISRPWSLNDQSFYYLVLVIFILCFLIMRWIINSWFGKALIGIRENESRMLIFGYNTWAYKYIIYLISGVFAAIGGLLSCFYRGIAAPDDFSFSMSGSFLLMVLIGGRGTLLGPVLGSFFVVFITNYLSAYTKEWMMVLGIIFILVVMFARRGIGGYTLEWWQRIKEIRIKP